MNVVITGGFRRDLNALSKIDRRHAWDAIEKLMESSNVHAGGLQTKKMKGIDDVYEIRATLEVRIIARRDGEDVCCMRVGRHDRALRAGAAGQVGALPDVERLRTAATETARALEGHRAADGTPAEQIRGPLAAFNDEELRMRFGIPNDWISAVRRLRTEEQFLSQDLEDVLTESGWFELAKLFPPTPIVSTGAAPTYRVPNVAVARAFEDGEIAELEFNLPVSSWAIVERSRPGPIFVRGGPGTGKSLLALYRALHGISRTPRLDRPEPKVLYATYTRTLADDARYKVELLRGEVPAGLEIATVDRLVERYAPQNVHTTYDQDHFMRALRDAISLVPDAARFEERFLRSEIDDVIVGRGLQTFGTYAAVSRTGRHQRLGRGDRSTVWAVYEHAKATLSARGLRTIGEARIAALTAVRALPDDKRFDLVVVDEVQDLTTAALAFVVAMARTTVGVRDVTLIGDGGQSIYRSGFKWADVGLRLTGNSVTSLATCERSTVEILHFAAALAGRQADDGDASLAEVVVRSGAIPRVLSGFSDREDQRAWLVADLRRRLTEVAARRVAVIGKTKGELERVREALTKAGIDHVDYGSPDFHRRDAVRCITAHSAKGLEFGDVYVVGVDDGTFPTHDRNLTDDERAERLGIEARLLYVAVTRARDRLTLLSGTNPSPFLTPALPFAETIQERQ